MNKFKKLETQIQNNVVKYLDLASQHYKRNFTLDILQFDLRGGAAGQFVVKRVDGRFIKSIRINQFMLEQNGNNFIDEVVPHECAHLVVFELWGRKTKASNKRVRPHGPEWKEVMRLFDKEPRVRHRFSLDGKERKIYQYNCSCPGKVHELTIIRHNKVMKRGVNYQCNKCLGVLQRKSPLSIQHKKSA